MNIRKGSTEWKAIHPLRGGEEEHVGSWFGTYSDDDTRDPLIAKLFLRPYVRDRSSFVIPCDVFGNALTEEEFRDLVELEPVVPEPAEPAGAGAPGTGAAARDLSP